MRTSANDLFIHFFTRLYNILKVQAEDTVSSFNETFVSERTTLIELKSVYGLSELRDETETNGTGNINTDDTSYILSTGTTSGSYAILNTAEIGRYVPGLEASSSLGLNVTKKPQNDGYIEWGYFNGFNQVDGMGFGEDKDGLYIFVVKSGSKTVVRQDDWNVNTLKGAGGTLFTPQSIDTSDGYVYHQDFIWYGYGNIKFRVLAKDKNGGVKLTTVHRFSIDNDFILDNPNLPLSVMVDNGGGTDDIECKVGGRQFSVKGKYLPNLRINGQYVFGKAINGTFEPVINFRRKAGRETSIKPTKINLIPTKKIIYEIRLNPTLTGANWRDPDDIDSNETTVKVDTEATDSTGGTTVYAGLVAASKEGGQSNIRELVLNLPTNGVYSLVIKTIEGGSGAVDAYIGWGEEW